MRRVARGHECGGAPSSSSTGRRTCASSASSATTSSAASSLARSRARLPCVALGWTWMMPSCLAAGKAPCRFPPPLSHPPTTRTRMLTHNSRTYTRAHTDVCAHGARRVLLSAISYTHTKSRQPAHAQTCADAQGNSMQRMCVCRHADRYVPDWSRDVRALLQDKQEEEHLTADLPLSPLGHRQAQELAAHLALQDVTSIICSPYLRCIQTAHAISVATGARICIEPGLSEGPGHVRGWLPDMLERKRYFPEIDLSYRPLAPEPEGETCDRDVIPRGVRMSRALSGLEPTRGQLVVVTHASVMLSLVAAAAAGVGHVGGLEGEVTATDLEAVDGTLLDMDGSRPGGYFSLERPRIAERERDLDTSDLDLAIPRGQGEEEGGEEEEEQKWASDLSCYCTHLSREACEDGTGTSVYRLPVAANDA
eukprot:Tamp_07465.p1 GENE.Tamp_07465~~Tamp_07465.p1  ORF type:complete len:423 (+),score=45.88 Tamp_07465:431-1699(+)